MKTSLRTPRIKIWTAFVAAALFLNVSSHAQGTFVNLDFEHPVLPLVPGGVPMSKAFPGWSAFGTTVVAYDTISLGGAAISLQDSGSAFYLQLQGSYSALLQGSSAGPATSAAISQTGQLPTDAASIHFWAAPVSNMQVTMDGQLIPLFLLSSTPTYNILGGDISMFAGQTRELRFTALANNGGYFDNVQFSNQPVPEPSTISLLLVTLGLAGFRMWKSTAG